MQKFTQIDGRKNMVRDKEYTFTIGPFDREVFEKNVLFMVADYFSTGVKVNGIVYTLEGGIFPVVGGMDHVPMEYHEGACILFFTEILSGVAADEYSDAEQMDVIAQINVIMSMKSDFTKVSIKTNSVVKFREYEEVVHEIMGKDLNHLPVITTELQAPSIDNAMEKVRASKLEKGELIFAQDLSFEFSALGGAPGPYIKDFLACNAPHRIDSMVYMLDNRDCCAEIAMAAVFVRDGVVHSVRSVTRCEGKWADGSTRTDVEDSFLYGIDCNLGLFRKVLSKRTGKELSMMRVSLFWLLARINCGKPHVKIKRRIKKEIK